MGGRVDDAHMGIFSTKSIALRYVRAPSRWSVRSCSKSRRCEAVRCSGTRTGRGRKDRPAHHRRTAAGWITDLAKAADRSLMQVTRACRARSIDAEKGESMHVFACPQRHAGAAIDSLDLDHLIRVSEIDPAGRAGVRKRGEQQFIEEALFRLR